jgi:hypothetical protein
MVSRSRRTDMELLNPQFAGPSAGAQGPEQCQDPSQRWGPPLSNVGPRVSARRFVPVVRTFYDPLDYLKDQRLLDLWQENWRHFGWAIEVVDLTAARAADPARYARWESAATLYTVGDKHDYVFRCYARWLTMLQGGLMVDFDVFNYGLTPRMAEDIIRAAPADRVIHFSGDPTPCAEYGTAAAYEGYCRVFDSFIDNPALTTESLRAHVHDLNILSVNRHAWQPIKMCSHYPKDPHWDCYPLTHFTHGHVRYPRSARIPKLRRFRVSSQATPLGCLWSRLLG